MEFTQCYFAVSSLLFLLLFAFFFTKWKNELSKKFIDLSIQHFVQSQIDETSVIQVEAVVPVIVKNWHDMEIDDINSNRFDPAGGEVLNFREGPYWARSSVIKIGDKIAIFEKRPIGLFMLIKRYWTNDFIRPDIYAIYSAMGGLGSPERRGAVRDSSYRLTSDIRPAATIKKNSGSDNVLAFCHKKI